MIADIAVCNSQTSQHTMQIAGTNMADPNFRLTLQPGDCYFTSGGERVKLTVPNRFRLDRNDDGKFGGKRPAGDFMVRAYKTPHTITVRVC